MLVFGGAALASRVGTVLEAPAPAVASPAPIDQTGSWGMRWLRAFARLAIQLIPEYIVVVGLLGFARAYLFPVAADLGNGVLLMLGLAVAGTLFVIPTAGEIPIIQTLLLYGIGAGRRAAADAAIDESAVIADGLEGILLAGARRARRLTAIVGLLAGCAAIVLGL